MKKLLSVSVLALIAALSANANQWSNASYVALANLNPSKADNLRSLIFFDATGAQLGYINLQTSGYENADSFAIGKTIVPNGKGKEGVVLARTKVGATVANAVRDINFYADAVGAEIKNGALLARTQPTTYGVIFVTEGSKANPQYVDKLAGLGVTPDGRLSAVVQRENAADGAIISSYLYSYVVPNTSTGPVNLKRDTEKGPLYINLINKRVTAFAYGKFTNKVVEGASAQIALLLEGGEVSIKQLSNQKQGPVGHITNFDVTKDGKAPVAIWSDSFGTFSALYPDNSVAVWDVASKKISKEYAFKPAAEGVQILAVHAIGKKA